MALFELPDWMIYQRADLVVRNASTATPGVFGAGDQTVSHPGSRWGWDIEFAAQPLDVRAMVEGYWIGFEGLRHRVLMSDFQLSTPMGTIRRTGVTMRAAVPQFGRVLPLANCGVTATLRMGDWVEAFGQCFRVIADAVATAGGSMDVKVAHEAHALIPAGTPVVIDNPRMLCGLVDRDLNFPRQAGEMQPPFMLRLIERPRGS